MKVTVGVVFKPVAPIGGTNPLPRFRDRNHHHPDKKLHPSMQERHSQLVGYECASRILPYRMQDRYTRNRSVRGVKTITLENERLRAVFYPEYGGRLTSLFDKQYHKELLQNNPVIQPGNLAIRDAWLATGIEFNCSQFGHHFLTCDPLFAVRCKEENGEEFLRMYEYERCKGVYYQIDFHLPSGSQFLYLYAKIINPSDLPVSSYWWTNIDLPEVEGVRVFSATDEVIYYMSPEQLKQYPGYANMAVGHLPHLESVPGADISYPRNYPFATDYFFQIPKKEPMPWEAAAYPDGFVMYEASSPVLRFHKMFCWGVSTGGQRWRDFLSEPGKGNFFEIQAGLAPTQTHGLIMEPGEVIDFVQAFGSLYVEPGSLQALPWHEAQQQLSQKVHENITAADIEKLLLQYRADGERTPDELLHSGSGYGALELRRRAKFGDGWAPKGMVFPDASWAKTKIPGWLWWIRVFSPKPTHPPSRLHIWSTETGWPCCKRHWSRKKTKTGPPGSTTASWKRSRAISPPPAAALKRALPAGRIFGRCGIWPTPIIRMITSLRRWPVMNGCSCCRKPLWIKLSPKNTWVCW